jgi:hypothetical protein
MASTNNIPSWHSEESARIEALQWNEKPEDFETLYSHIAKKISEELRDQGKDLSEIATEDELRRQVRSAAQSYDDKRRELIGLEIHVTLWIRGFVATRIRTQAEPDK